jgi:hypothetical protein
MFFYELRFHEKLRSSETKIKNCSIEKLGCADTLRFYGRINHLNLCGRKLHFLFEEEIGFQYGKKSRLFFKVEVGTSIRFNLLAKT